jgi:hypothetical protein
LEQRLHDYCQVRFIEVVGKIMGKLKRVVGAVSSSAVAAAALALGATPPAHAAGAECGSPMQLGPKSYVTACIYRSGSYALVQARLTNNDYRDTTMWVSNSYLLSSNLASVNCPLKYASTNPYSIPVRSNQMVSYSSGWCYMPDEAVAVVKATDWSYAGHPSYATSPLR